MPSHGCSSPRVRLSCASKRATTIRESFAHSLWGALVETIQELPHPLSSDSLRRRSRGSIRPSLKLQHGDDVLHCWFSDLDPQPRCESRRFLYKSRFPECATAITPASKRDSAVNFNGMPELVRGPAILQEKSSPASIRTSRPGTIVSDRQ